VASDPNYNFLQSLKNTTDDEFLSNSPYDTSIFDTIYVNPLEFSAHPISCSSLKIMSFNIQSLSAKFADFVELLSILDSKNALPDIICLQEIWQIMPYMNFQLNGYHPLCYKSRTHAQGGGVGIYVKSNLTYKLLPECSVFVERIYESIFIEVALQNKSCFTIGSVYRPGATHPTLTPLALFNEFSDLFSNLLDNLNSRNNLIITGDFNIDVLQYAQNSRASDFIDLLFSFGLLQVVTKPTRCYENSATLIDHFITNMKLPVYDIKILTSRVSDHFPVLFSISANMNHKNQQKTVTKRNFSKNNVDKFKNALKNISWKDVEDANGAQASYNLFSDIFLNFYDLYFPLKTIKFNKKFHKIEPWFSAGLLVSRATKLKLSNFCSKNPSRDNIKRYHDFRNLYNRITRIAKKNYYDEQFQKNTRNLKKTWELIFSAMNCDNSKLPLTQLFSNGITYTNPADIANELNKFFVSAPLKIVEKIPPADPPVSVLRTEKTFNFTDSPITLTEISDTVSQLLSKKSEDMYGLSMNFIKSVLSCITLPLFYIFTKSLESGIVPSQLKIARVVPIFKSGDPTLPTNYRPISLLPNFSKILEKIVANRLTFHMESNNLFSKTQFGFRKAHSTVHPLIQFLNHLSKANNKKLYTIAIFCDLQKAFDTVDHQILLRKLSNLGVTNVSLKWFENYLSNRKQFVTLNNHNSSLLDILIGVPQGSILGPLLFLIYINDLSQCTDLDDFLFADDTTLLKSHENLVTLANLVNFEFQKVVLFFRSHKLALHPEKTKFMIFSSHRNILEPQIFTNFNDPGSDNNLNPILPMQCLNSSDQPFIKFLGVYLDPQLNFKKHISILNSKLSKSLYFLRKTKKFLNQRSLKFIYYATMHSNLIYAIQAYSCTSQSNLLSLFKKQKAAIRIIANSSYNAHTEPLFKQLNVLPFPQLCEFFKLQFMHHFTQGFLPEIFNETWITNRIVHDGQSEIELRNEDDFHIPFARTNLISIQPLIAFPKMWDSFPEGRIKFIRNKLEFNKELKEHFLNNLNSIIVCNRLFCPSCIS